MKGLHAEWYEKWYIMKTIDLSFVTTAKDGSCYGWVVEIDFILFIENWILC